MWEIERFILNDLDSFKCFPVYKIIRDKMPSSSLILRLFLLVSLSSKDAASIGLYVILITVLRASMERK